MITVIEFLVLVCVLGFSLSVATGSKPVSKCLPLLMATVAVIASTGLVLAGRSVAVPILVMSLVCLIAGICLRGREERRRPVLAAGVFALSALALLPALMLASKPTFPALEGPHKVGVRAAEIKDIHRGNDWEAVGNNTRRILIRLWYPAVSIPETASNHRHPPAERQYSSVLSGGGFDPFKLIGEALLDTNTHAWWNVAPLPGSFPLLVFSHGYGGHVATNSVLMEQLASRGYVVVSITHPGESSSLVYLDGQPMPQAPQRRELLAEHAATNLFDAFYLDTAERMAWAVDTFEPIRMVSQRFPVWADDFQSVVSALQGGEFNGDIGDILEYTDFESIGFLGMSAGGGSATAACHSDSRCSAVAALDGGLGLPFLRDAPIRTPALIFEGGYPKRLGAQDLYYEPHSEFGRNPEVTRLVFPDNGHADFTDLALALSPLGKSLFPKLLPVLGPVDGVQSIRAQSQLTARFFDIYLKGQSAGQFPQRELLANPVVRQVDPEPFRAWIKAVTARRARY